MRIAAIDIGTNSIHMIVVQVRQDLSFEVIDREKDMVRLGAGGLDGRKLTATATTAALQTLSKFKRLADSHKVDEIVAAATSATREAENGGDFIAEVDRQTGIRVRVITGTEEARLIHLAAGYGVDVGGSTAVVVDIGGGSVEVTLGTATQLTLGKSFKAGVIRLTERFVKSDPLSERDERKLVKHLNRQMAGTLDEIAARGFARVIGTSGTILSLGALALAEDGAAPPADLRNRRVTAKALHRLRKRLVAADIEERLQIPGLDPRRADLSVAGAVLLDTIIRRLGADEFTLCDLALREGLVLDYIHRNSAAHPQGRALPRRPPPQHRRARRALRLLVRALAAGGAAGAEHLRPDAERAQPDRQGTRVAGVCGAAARRRRAHQLRAPPPALVLPDQEWRPARLRARGDRDHGARGPVSPRRPRRRSRTTATAT